MKHQRLKVFFEFLLFGVIMGITEDLVAVGIVTGKPITWNVIGIVTLVALVFALIGELLVDKYNVFGFNKKGK